MTANTRFDEPLRIGRYAITGPIARGGMAEVFLGRAKEPDGKTRLVAIKRILRHLADQA
jgi:serine/threonine-protein kinase